MSEKSTILIPDPRYEGEAIIVYGFPEGQMVVRGIDGAVLHDGRNRGEQPETPALPKPGALIGDAPFSNLDQEIPSAARAKEDKK